MELTIKKLAKVNLGDHHSLPDSPGIYFACDAAFRVWYIGISTTSLRSRHQKHERIEEFKLNQVQHLCYFNWNDINDLEEWESEYIKKYNPPLNKNFIDPELPLVDLGYDKSQYLARYKEIKLMQRALEQELDDLKPNLVTLIESNGGKLKTGEISAWLNKRATYQFSLEVQQIEQLLKNKKEEEKRMGIAEVVSETVFPVVR